MLWIYKINKGQTKSISSKVGLPIDLDATLAGNVLNQLSEFPERVAQSNQIWNILEKNICADSCAIACFTSNSAITAVCNHFSKCAYLLLIYSGRRSNENTTQLLREFPKEQDTACYIPQWSKKVTLAYDCPAKIGMELAPYTFF